MITTDYIGASHFCQNLYLFLDSASGICCDLSFNYLSKANSSQASFRLRVSGSALYYFFYICEILFMLTVFVMPYELKLSADRQYEPDPFLSILWIDLKAQRVKSAFSLLFQQLNQFQAALAARGLPVGDKLIKFLSSIIFMLIIII